MNRNPCFLGSRSQCGRWRSRHGGSPARTLIVAVVLLLVPVCWLSAADQQAKQLRWKFSPGQTLQVRSAQTVETETSGGIRPLAVNVDMQLEMTWNVESVADTGAARITQTFDRLRVRMESADQPALEFDSRAAGRPAGPASEIAEAVAPLLEAKLLVTISPRGEILEVEFPPALADRGQPASATNLLSVEQLQQLLGRSVMVLPEEAVEPQDSWSEVSRLSLPWGDVQQRMEFTYEGEVERDGRPLEQILFRAELDAEQTDKPPAVQLRNFEQTGELWFDSAAGRAQALEVRQRFGTQQRYREFDLRVQVNSSLKMEFSQD